MADMSVTFVGERYSLSLDAYSGESVHPFRSIPSTCSRAFRPFFWEPIDADFTLCLRLLVFSQVFRPFKIKNKTSFLSN
jgi:hypothetical protein